LATPQLDGGPKASDERAAFSGFSPLLSM